MPSSKNVLTGWYRFTHLSGSEPSVCSICKVHSDSIAAVSLVKEKNLETGKELEIVEIWLYGGLGVMRGPAADNKPFVDFLES